LSEGSRFNYYLLARGINSGASLNWLLKPSQEALNKGLSNLIGWKVGTLGEKLVNPLIVVKAPWRLKIFPIPSYLGLINPQNILFAGFLPLGFIQGVTSFGGELLRKGFLIGGLNLGRFSQSPKNSISI